MGRGPSGFFLTAALGIGGACRHLHRAGAALVPARSVGRLFGAVVGAVLLLVLYHLFNKKD